MSALTHRQTTIRRDLLGSAMNRLVNALSAPRSDTYAEQVAHRVRFIAGKVRTLPVDTQQEVLSKVKEHLEKLCNDDALKARLLAQLDHRVAA